MTQKLKKQLKKQLRSLNKIQGDVSEYLVFFMSEKRW